MADLHLRSLDAFPDAALLISKGQIISSNAMAKLGKNESVKVEVLAKICNHLDCTMDDIMEVLTDKESV